jgi:hypothetical protein
MKNLSISTLITILIIMGGVVGTHYKGLADSKEYTDQKVEKVEIKTEEESFSREG